MGTAHLLDALRDMPGLEAILVVTSDKVYRNEGRGEVFGEESLLGGSDPYSASKVATEAVVNGYADSYFTFRAVPLATARGGNVVGGGDFSSDRLIPDIFRAVSAGQDVELRYPDARRPWQHVLDCLSGYFLYVEFLARTGLAEPRSINFGPARGSDLTVAEIATSMIGRLKSDRLWRPAAGEAPSEKQMLMLDNSLAKATLGWSPKLDIDETIAWTAEWYAAFAAGGDPLSLVRAQIARYQTR
jgi:CDP-glucose 4,6-dehydratase